MKKTVIPGPKSPKPVAPPGPPRPSMLIGRRGTSRSRARFAAVQALYQMAMTGAGADAAAREFLHHRLDAPPGEAGQTEIDETLFTDILHGVATAGEELDNMIAGVLSEGHEVDRLEMLLRLILRAGAYELSNRFDVPARVTIGEYMSVAWSFYDRATRSLVNATLDRLARTLRPEEMEGHGDGRPPAG